MGRVVIDLRQDLNALNAAYDKTKNNRRGRYEVSSQLTAQGNTEDFLGPGLVETFDFFAATTPNTAPLSIMFSSSKVNSDVIRVFVPTAFAASALRIHMLKFNVKTKKFVGYVGAVNFTVPSGTHTLRDLKILDNGTTGWKVFFNTTNATTAANGGLFMTPDVAESQFQPVSFPTLPTATAPGQNAVYKLENSPFTFTAAAGLAMFETQGEIVIRNGTAAATSFFGRFNFNGTITTVGVNGATTDLVVAVSNAISTGFVGVSFQNNSMGSALPGSDYGSLNNVPCVATGTASNLYLFPLASITNGATTLAGMQGWDILAAVNQITAPTASQVQWSDILQKFIYITNVSTFIVKQGVNGAIFQRFGCTSNKYVEGVMPVNTLNEFGSALITGMDAAQGFLFTVGTTVGQRVIQAIDLYSDQSYGNTYIVTKITETPFRVLETLASTRWLVGRVNRHKVFFKTSNDINDTIFDNENTGWQETFWGTNLNNILLRYSQFKLMPVVTGEGLTNPEKIQKIIITGQLINENSQYIIPDMEASTKAGVFPVYSAARMVEAFPSGSVPKLYYTAYDINKNQLIALNTVDNASSFQYSTDGGTTWLAWGAVPNVVGTKYRVNVSVLDAELILVSSWSEIGV